MIKKTRIDKWLWSVRIFKSRTLATNACKSGKVKVDGKNVKPSAFIEVDQIIDVKKNGFDLQFKVIKLIEKRVGAPLAVECYEDRTPEEELNKFKSWYVGKAAAESREKGTGRPTKRERRDIDQFKDIYLEWEDLDDMENQ